METVAGTDNRDLTRIQGSPMTSRADAEEVSCWHRESVDYHSDPAEFFIIEISRAAGGIVVEHYKHYNSSFELPRVLHGKKALEIYPTIIRNGWVTKLGHAAYLGRELEKAELALQRGWTYEQNEDVKER